jgi:FkbM family methyltransferase
MKMSNLNHSKPIFVILFVFAIVFLVFINQQTTESSINPSHNYESKPTDDRKIAESVQHESKSILLETRKLMNKNVNEDDLELINFVRTLIKPPSKLPLNLKDMNRKDFSQTGQSLIMDQKLNSIRNGFFVEAGGWDGEEFSNTLFFERERNWTGILIEPIPELYAEIVKRNRKIYTLNACIADDKPFIAKMRVAGYLSGRPELMSDQHKQRLESEKQSNNFTSKGTYVDVPCFPLYSILKAIGVATVDFFSLDIEGAEWEVIKSLPYDKIDFKSFLIEYPANPATTQPIITKLAANGLIVFEKDNQDLFIIKQ